MIAVSAKERSEKPYVQTESWCSDERVHARKAPGRLRRGRQSGGAGAADRARDPDAAVPGLQYSIRIDEGHAAGRRLSVRLAIYLWLQPLFAAVFIATLFRPHLRLLAAPRRCRSLCPAARPQQ